MEDTVITAEEPTATLVAVPEGPNGIRVQTVELDTTTLTADPEDADDPATYRLDVATSNENVVLVWAYVDWGDGTQVQPDPANGFSFTHRYTEPGTYDVAVTVYVDPPTPQEAPQHFRAAPTISTTLTATVS